MTASRRRQRTGATALALIGILSLLAAFMPGIASADPPQGKKVAVCKYVGKPGVDERLKDGKNPIEVARNSIQNNEWDGTLPGYFSDAHDRSFVLGFVEDGPFDADDCPEAVGPPTFDVLPDKEWLGDVPDGAEAVLAVQVDGVTVGDPFTFDSDGNLVGDTDAVELDEGTEYTIVETSVGGVEGWTCEDVTDEQGDDAAADTIYNECVEEDGGEPETFTVLPDKEWVGDVPDGAVATIEVRVEGEEPVAFSFDDEGNLIGDTDAVELDEGTEYTIVETSVGGVEGWACEDVTDEQGDDAAADTIYNECVEEDGGEPETFTVLPDKVWVGGAPAGAQAVIEVQVGGVTVGDTFTFDSDGNLVGEPEPVELDEGTEYAVVEIDVVSVEGWDCDQVQVDDAAVDTIYNECVEEDDEPPVATSITVPPFDEDDGDDGDDGDVGGEVVENEGDDEDEGTGSVGGEIAELEAVQPETAPQMLPRTGATSVPLAAGGAVALLMGLAMLAATRRTDAST